MVKEWDYIKVYATKTLEGNEKINYFYETHFEYGPYSVGHLCSNKEKIGKSLSEMLKKSESRTKKPIHLISETETLNNEELKEIKKYLKKDLKDNHSKRFPNPKITLEKKV